MAPVPQKSISPLTWVVLTAFGFVLFVAAAVVLITFSSRTGSIKPQIFYFLLVLIGLIASGFLFGAMKSHAKYSGKVYDGTLELGGPTVLFIIVIYMGIKFSGTPEAFNLRFMVFGSADKSELVNDGMLKVLFDKPDSARIVNGSVDFTDVSADLHGKKITIIPVARGYMVKAQQVDIPAESSSVEIHLLKKADTIIVSGIVVDKTGQPVTAAHILFGGEKQSCNSDNYGNFSLPLPVSEGTELPVRVYTGSKLRYNNTLTLSAKVAQTIQLH